MSLPALMHRSSAERNVEAIKVFLADGADVNAKGENGATPLHFATGEGYKEIIELLIANSANVNAKDDDGYSLLHVATLRGRNDKEIVELLTANGADTNAKDKDGATPLHFATGGGYKEIIELLIANSANVNAKDDGGYSLLHVATLRGRNDKEIVELLIANGADVNAKAMDGGTPLHNAAAFGHKEVVGLLIAKGVDVNSKNNDFKTPLDWAIEEWMSDSNKKENVDLLRKHGGFQLSGMLIWQAAKSGRIGAVEGNLTDGADVNAKDKDGSAPLHYAATFGHKEIVELLIAKGADTNAKDTDGLTPLYTAIKNFSYFGIKDRRQPYGHSQGENHELVLIQIIELLLANGADVNPMYGLGKETPLDYVKETPLAFKSDESIEHILRKHGGFTIRELYSVTEHIMDAASIGHYGAVRQHLASGVSANWRGKWSDSRGGLSGSNLTPLYAAAINGHKKVAELLINNGAKVNAKNFSDASPLYAAAKDGHKEVAELLIAKGADVNVKTSDGYSLLYVATSGNYWNRNEKEIVELLIANGADVNAKAKDGGTPLHNAASSGGFSYDSTAPGYGTAKEIVELLIAKGANVNRRDNDGMTPLHIACGGSGNKEIAKLLIEKGADINAKSVGSNKSFYETPLDVPLSLDQDFWQTKDLFDLRNLLRKHGGKTSKELKAEGK